MTDAAPEHLSAVRTGDHATIRVRVECGTATVVCGPAVQSTPGEREQFEHLEPHTMPQPHPDGARKRPHPDDQNEQPDDLARTGTRSVRKADRLRPDSAFLRRPFLPF